MSPQHSKRKSLHNSFTMIRGLLAPPPLSSKSLTGHYDYCIWCSHIFTFHNQVYLASASLDFNKKRWLREGEGQRQTGLLGALPPSHHAKQGAARTGSTERASQTLPGGREWIWHVSSRSKESQNPEGKPPRDRKAREPNKATGWETDSQNIGYKAKQNQGANKI